MEFAPKVMPLTYLETNRFKEHNNPDGKKKSHLKTVFQKSIHLQCIFTIKEQEPACCACKNLHQ